MCRHEVPLHKRNIHSICAHARYGLLGTTQGRAFIDELLDDGGLMKKSYLRPGVLVFDSWGCAEFGGSWTAVHALISATKRVGWSDADANAAVCAQVVPGNKKVENISAK